MANASRYQSLFCLIEGADIQELGKIRDLAKDLINEKRKEKDPPYVGYEERTIIVLGNFEHTDYDIEDFEHLLFGSEIKKMGLLKKNVKFIVFKNAKRMEAVIKRRDFTLDQHKLTAISVKEYIFEYDF